MDNDQLPRLTFRDLIDANGLPERWKERPLIPRVFIDDLSAIEKVPIAGGIQ